MRGRVRGAVVAIAMAASCASERAETPTPPVFDRDVASILQDDCTGCHGGNAPAAGWRATSYLDAIACVPSGQSATNTDGGRAPIVAVLESESHRGLIDEAGRAVIASWVELQAPAFVGTVHRAKFIDPRSPSGHNKMLRDRHYRPMLDAFDPNACGRCHDGSPARPAGVLRPAPGATSCTSCHDGAAGVLACDTCHGTRGRAYPPRDACFFPDESRPDAHRAHMDPSSTRPALACATCHPIPGTVVIGGTHGNGSVEVTFDSKLVSPEASYDRATRSCAVSCHDRGGNRARPAFDDTKPVQCGDCHGSPPGGHYPGACTTCHPQANADGTALSAGDRHMNGVVDLGDSGGGCGACHGRGDDPWPTTGAHRAHRDPDISGPIACATCHPVPDALHAPLHMNGRVDVVFSGGANQRGASPQYDRGSCKSVACHGEGLGGASGATPTWTDTSGAASRCGACHGVPPSQHTADASCDRSTCHGSEIERTFTALRISPSGRADHVDGKIDSAH